MLNLFTMQPSQVEQHNPMQAKSRLKNNIHQIIHFQKQKPETQQGIQEHQKMLLQSMNFQTMIKKMKVI